MKGLSQAGLCSKWLMGMVLTIIFTWSATILHAQTLEQSMIAPYLERMTTAQRQIFDDVMAKSGGQIPLEVLTAIKSSNGQMTPELIDVMRKNGIELTSDQVETLKTGKMPENKQPEPVQSGKKQSTDKTNTAEVKPGPSVEQKDAKPVATKAEEPTLQRFGTNLFKSGRARIQAIEDMIGKGQIPPTAQKDAIAGFVGPVDMGAFSVNATAPSSYALSPGDQVTIYYWGDMMELTSVKIALDDKGDVTIPKAGRLVARGMSLPQFQDAAKNLLARGFGKNVNVVTTLDSLRSIQIFITGSAFRPGSYAVSSNTTLFNALLSSGGPSDAGSLRDIRLIRNGKTTTVDFYSYLMHGDSKNDLSLQSGDTIHISRTDKLVSIEGEVNRPAIYELKNGERLKDLVRIAEGIKPGGLSYRVHITSIIPNKGRVVADVDMSGNAAVSDRELFDGDSVSVMAIVPEILNKVTLSGNVKYPGVYELKKNMSVSDLFNEVNQPWPEAYLDRAEIVRLNEDRKTTTIIPFHLGKALQKDSVDNIKLAPLDKVVVYSKWDVQFYPERTVTIKGSVQKPDDYIVSEGMTVNDLVFKAGGVMPEAYLDRAEIVRLNEDRKTTTIIPFHLGKALQKDSVDNIKLAPLDKVVVYSKWDVQFYPERTVTIKGALQNPGNFSRSEGMKISDLIIKAGGLMPNVYLDRAEVLRYDFVKETYEIISLDIRQVLEKERSHDIDLKDKDILYVFAIKDAKYSIPHEVDIHGAVQRPGEFKRGEGMRLDDLLFEAGGLLPGASSEITIAKGSGTGETIVIKVNYDLVMKGDQGHNLLLDDADIVMVREDSEYFEKPRWVTVKGEIRYPGSYPMLKRDESISDILARAGGLTDMANAKGAVYMRKSDFIPSAEQKRDIEIINKLTNSLNDLEYRRQIARNLWLLQGEAAKTDSTIDSSTQVISGSGTVSEAAALALAPSIAEASGKIATDAIEVLETGAGSTTAARKLENKELALSDRIVVNLEKALNGDSKENIKIHEGDSLTIPRKMETVSIVGAVMKPVTINFNYKLKLKNYISRAGGFAADGDPDRVIITRVDGTVITAEEIDSVEAGDLIYVPTKVISTEITTTADKVISVLKFTLATLASVVVFLALI